jgi:hypothetical protein
MRSAPCRLVALALLALLAACATDSPATGDDDDEPIADADPFAPDADPTAPDADPGAPDAAPVPSTPACRETCTTAGDCVPASPSGLTDLDNYACEDQRCRYLGCRSTSECQTVYNSTAYVCATLAGQTIPGCHPTCGAPADCATPQSPILGADNYACEAGRCRWLGCASTAECQEAYGTAAWTCAPIPGAGLKTCWPTCGSAADCAGQPPLFDAENYACEAGRCVWTGCKSSGECATANQDPAWICE